MPSFTTDDLAPGDRFEYWREVRSKNLFGVTIELPRERRASFTGRYSGSEIGGAQVSTVEASPYLITRANADIARLAGNSLSINRQISGFGMLDVGEDDPQAVRDGETIFSHSDMPFTATPVRAGGFSYRMLLIPLRGEIALDASAENMLATTSARGSPFSRAISALFNALTSQEQLPYDPAAAVTHIARLVLLDRGRLKLGLSETRAAIRAGLFQAALQMLDRELHRPGLSPGRVAGELGVSLRQLHLLFEPSGQSFSRTLAAKRLQRAYRLFETEPLLSITEIAHRCGIESQPTFYRAFRHAFGMTPGDRQALIRGG